MGRTSDRVKRPTNKYKDFHSKFFIVRKIVKRDVKLKTSPFISSAPCISLSPEKDTTKRKEFDHILHRLELQLKKITEGEESESEVEKQQKAVNQKKQMVADNEALPLSTAQFKGLERGNVSIFRLKRKTPTGNIRSTLPPCTFVDYSIGREEECTTTPINGPAVPESLQPWTKEDSLATTSALETIMAENTFSTENMEQENTSNLNDTESQLRKFQEALKKRDAGNDSAIKMRRPRKQALVPSEYEKTEERSNSQTKQKADATENKAKNSRRDPATLTNLEKIILHDHCYAIPYQVENSELLVDEPQASKSIEIPQVRRPDHSYASKESTGSKSKSKSSQLKTNCKRSAFKASLKLKLASNEVEKTRRGRPAGKKSGYTVNAIVDDELNNTSGTVALDSKDTIPGEKNDTEIQTKEVNIENESRDSPVTVKSTFKLGSRRNRGTKPKKYQTAEVNVENNYSPIRGKKNDAEFRANAANTENESRDSPVKSTFKLDSRRNRGKKPKKYQTTEDENNESSRTLENSLNIDSRKKRIVKPKEQQQRIEVNAENKSRDSHVTVESTYNHDSRTNRTKRKAQFERTEVKTENKCRESPVTSKSTFNLDSRKNRPAIATEDYIEIESKDSPVTFEKSAGREPRMKRTIKRLASAKATKLKKYRAKLDAAKRLRESRNNKAAAKKDISEKAKRSMGDSASQVEKNIPAKINERVAESKETNVEMTRKTKSTKKEEPLRQIFRIRRTCTGPLRTGKVETNTKKATKKQKESITPKNQTEEDVSDKAIDPKSTSKKAGVRNVGTGSPVTDDVTSDIQSQTTTEPLKEIKRIRRTCVGPMVKIPSKVAAKQSSDKNDVQKEATAKDEEMGNKMIIMDDILHFDAGLYDAFVDEREKNLSLKIADSWTIQNEMSQGTVMENSRENSATDDRPKRTNRRTIPVKKKTDTANAESKRKGKVTVREVETQTSTDDIQNDDYHHESYGDVSDEEANDDSPMAGPSYASHSANNVSDEYIDSNEPPQRSEILEAYKKPTCSYWIPPPKKPTRLRGASFYLKLYREINNSRVRLATGGYNYFNAGRTSLVSDDSDDDVMVVEEPVKKEHVPQITLSPEASPGSERSARNDSALNWNLGRELRIVLTRIDVGQNRTKVIRTNSAETGDKAETEGEVARQLFQEQEADDDRDDAIESQTAEMNPEEVVKRKVCLVKKRTVKTKDKNDANKQRSNSEDPSGKTSPKRKLTSAPKGGIEVKKAKFVRELFADQPDVAADTSIPQSPVRKKAKLVRIKYMNRRRYQLKKKVTDIGLNENNRSNRESETNAVSPPKKAAVKTERSTEPDSEEDATENVSTPRQNSVVSPRRKSLAQKTAIRSREAIKDRSSAEKKRQVDRSPSKSAKKTDVESTKGKGAKLAKKKPGARSRVVKKSLGRSGRRKTTNIKVEEDLDIHSDNDSEENESSPKKSKKKKGGKRLARIMEDMNSVDKTKPLTSTILSAERQSAIERLKKKIAMGVESKKIPRISSPNKLSTEQLHPELQITQTVKARSAYRFVCPVDGCEKRFRTRINQLAHKRAHAPKKYHCEECGVSYAYRQALVKHLMTHEGIKPYECNQCGQCFTASSNLKAHLRSHFGIRPYKCDICGLAFSWRNVLSVHMRVHTRERQFECKVCHRKFAHKPSLKSHMHIHTGEKKHRCDECGMSYAWKESLEIHLRIHAGIKPYKCDQCDAAFVHKTYLMRHVKHHEEKKVYECCGFNYTRRYFYLKHREMKH